jgi:hypothetical protein
MSKITMRAEAEALERGAEILAKSAFGRPGPSQAVSQLQQALEILLRKEAERVRHKLRSRAERLAGVFTEEVAA